MNTVLKIYAVFSATFVYMCLLSPMVAIPTHDAL